MQVDSWSDEILTVAYREDLDPANKRVITENLRCLLSKLAPKKFGDRLLVAGDADSPIQHLHRQVSLVNLTDDQMEALENFTESLLIDVKSE